MSNIKFKNIRIIAWKFFLYLLMSLGAIIFTLPFLWMLSTSLKPSNQVFIYPIQWIPKPFVWRNYIDAWRSAPFGIYYLNTVIITVLIVLGTVLSSILSAYGFARLRFKGRDTLFLLILSAMMLPNQVTIIPQFLMFKFLGWLNTFLPLTVPAFFGPPFYIFLLRQYMLTLPTELDDAAFIDGCSKFQVLILILLPLLKPAVFTMTILTFLASWNEFFSPLIYLSEMKKYTVTLGLTLFRGEFVTYWNWLMAASVVAILPCLLIFMLFQRYFIQGIALTGLKG
jgi:ABC-type glycerol-3-phosphate transport system permease component